MTSTDNYKRYPGSVCLYQSSSQRPPVFLQRNLRKALNAHETALNAVKSQLDSAAPCRNLDTGMKRGNVRPWQPPTEGMLQDIIQGNAPILTIEPRGFVKRGLQAITREETPRPQDLPWLPPPDQIRLRCNISCSIAEVEEGVQGGQQRQIFIDNRKATVTSVTDEQGNCNFKIRMDRAFHIEADSLPSTNGLKEWAEPKTSKKITLRIGFSCTNSKEALQLLCALDPDVEAESVLTPDYTELRSHWMKLPECPTSMLSLRRYDDSEPTKRQTKRLNYVLDAIIAWNPSPNETVLESYNRARTKAGNKKLGLTIPQPVPIVKEPSNHRIIYTFLGSGQGVRSAIRLDLRCMFCPWRLPQSSFRRLHFHYLAHHDHFGFKVSIGAKDGPDLCDRRVVMDLAELKYERASNHVPDDREIAWIMPSQPFDLGRYLKEEGENKWAAKRLERLALVRLPNGKSTSFVGDGIARPQTSTSSFVKPNDVVRTKAKLPTEVPDLPSRKRKRFTVPLIPRVTIYRSTTKRTVDPGQDLSESDDDVEQSWLLTKHNREDFPQLSGAAREFAILFDDYFQHEKVCGDNVGPTIIRFTRACATQLRKPLLLAEFKVKLTQLVQADLISNDYMTFCLEHLEQLKDTGAQESNLQPRSTRSNDIPPLTYLQDGDVDMLSHERVVDDSEAEAEAGAELSPSAPKRHQGTPKDTRQAAVKSYEVCMCGKPALGVRGVIACANKQCQYSDFHISCVGLSTRTPGWYCPDCRVEQ